MRVFKLKTPLKEEDVIDLRAGDRVYLSGKIYTARDMAHRRFMEAIEKGEDLPFDVKDQVIFYVGPAPAKPGYVIGPCGPTTSYRMDKYTPILHKLGLRGTIGKGMRGKEVKEALRKYKGIYFVATGGVAALLCKKVKSSRIIAYEDLGTEAVRELEVEDLPLFVGIDTKGNDIYEKALES
ncbi:MAG: Fe-S-containing hydro-lyase [Thermoplasmata archaeon]|nr:MAG: Fe-S-containing hydro-lyase [Thermoplasmata archaeon]